MSTKCRLRTKTVDWHSSVHTDHKILNIEAHNEDKCTTNKMADNSFDPRNLYGRDSLTDRFLLHRDFHSWFNFATEMWKRNKEYKTFLTFLFPLLVGSKCTCCKANRDLKVEYHTILYTFFSVYKNKLSRTLALKFSKF